MVASARLRPSCSGASYEEAERLIRGRLIPGSLVSRRFRFIDEDDRLTPPMTDHAYLPAWMYIGRAFRPRSVVEYGCGLALASGSVALGHPPSSVLAIQDDAGEDYNWRLAQNNLRDQVDGSVVIHPGPFDGDDFQEDLHGGLWDMAIVNEGEGEYSKILYVIQSLYSRLSPGGVLAVDFVSERDAPARRAFEEFCLSQSMEPAVLPTRYGVGMFAER